MDFSHLLDDIPTPELPPPTPIGRDQITVMTCRRGTANKRFSAAGVTSYRVGKFFDVARKPVNHIFDMFAILKEVETEGQKFIIRGKPVCGLTNVVRRTRGEDATFIDAPAHWVCVDVDGQGEIDGAPIDVLKNYIEAVPQLSGVTCIGQLTSSWGIKPGIRAHLWFWLDEPRTSAQAATWAASLPVPVDGSLYNPVQPHYTAAPEFADMPDPLAGVARTFLIPGISDTLYIPEGSAESELQHWIDVLIRLDPHAEACHPILNKAAYSVGGWVGAGILEMGEAHQALIDACIESDAFESDRIDATSADIKRALEDGAKSPRVADDWKEGLIRNKEGVIKILPENYTMVFRKHPAMHGVLAFDLRTHENLIVSRPPWAAPGGTYPREVNDKDDVDAIGWLNRMGVHTSSLSTVASCLVAAGAENPIDRVVNWLDGLPAWDRIPRLDTWILKVVGCSDSVYHRAVGAKFIMALVARAYRPGCKCDDMPVFVGGQGTFKSTLLKEIACGPGDWAFTECLGDIKKPQDYIPTLMGPWLVEVAELSAFSKKEVEMVKKFLSTPVDRFRLSYGRHAINIPRRGCFAGTSNPVDFLSDATGGRRFNPIDVKFIEPERFVESRDQIFAEAIVRYRSGGVWWLQGDEIEGARHEQAAHFASDPWEDTIIDYVEAPPFCGVDADLSAPPTRKDKVTASEVLSDCLGVQSSIQTPLHSRRVGAILHRMGWERKRSRDGHGDRQYYFYRPEV